MAKGIIYVMTTIVPGLIKIGRTTSENFESTMYYFEKNGYFNVVGLKRKFAIEVENYEKKVELLNVIFSDNKVSKSELFALEIDVIIDLLSSFKGERIFPIEDQIYNIIDETEESIDETRERSVFDSDISCIPEGTYYLEQIVKGFGKIKGTAIVKDGKFRVKKGSICAPNKSGHATIDRKKAIIKNNVLQEDVICSTPSAAGWVIIGGSNNGWINWKNEKGQFIDIYRDKESKD